MAEKTTRSRCELMSHVGIAFNWSWSTFIFESSLYPLGIYFKIIIIPNTFYILYDSKSTRNPENDEVCISDFVGTCIGWFEPIEN